MVETRIPQAIDAIVAKLVTAFQNTPGVVVWDGPIVSGDYSDAVYIGFDGDYADGEERAVTSVQEWRGLGAKSRSEELQIAGAAVIRIGDGAMTWKPARDAAIALLTTVGQTLRADPSVGLGPPTVSSDFVAELWPGDMFQETGPEGMQVRIVFTIHCKTRV